MRIPAKYLPQHTDKVYIIPTRFGFLYLLGVLVMLIVGAAYSNNLVNLLAFFLVSLGLVAMLQTHFNLKGLKVRHCHVEGGFQGTTVQVAALVYNPSKSARYQLEVRPRRMKLAREVEANRPLGANESMLFRGWYEAEKRGRFKLTRIRISTVYPLGLFFAWMYLPVEAEYHIYPQPVGELKLPLTRTGTGTSFESDARGGDDYYGHRRFQPGDSPRHIDWKARARGRPLLVKEFNAGSPAAMSFNWTSLPGIATEKRLSQLCAWLETAHRKQLPYALNLPNQNLPAGAGRTHHQKCLEALARHEDPHNDSAAS